MRSDVPDDLRAFLEAGKQLQYDPTTCEAGRVVLHSPADLRVTVFHAQTYGTPLADLDPHAGEAGTYAVSGIDLVARCGGDYDPDGLLVWFPGEERYGTVDTSHDTILVFGPEVRWADIVASPAVYLNAQWAFEDLERADIEFLAPWPRAPWQGER